MAMLPTLESKRASAEYAVNRRDADFIWGTHSLCDPTVPVPRERKHAIYDEYGLDPGLSADGLPIRYRVLGRTSHAGARFDHSYI